MFGRGWASRRSREVDAIEVGVRCHGNKVTLVDDSGDDEDGEVKNADLSKVRKSLLRSEEVAKRYGSMEDDKVV